MTTIYLRWSSCLRIGKHCKISGFTDKIEENGSIPRYKEKIVVKGYRQRKGVDFDEIFSPVVKMSSIRVVLLVASLNLEVESMDVKITFLYGDLE